MSDFRLIAGPNSPFARKVVLALIAKGLLERTELIRVSQPVMTTTINPPLLALNPLGKVPVLEVKGGPTLYESDLICDYLDANYGDPVLIPPQGPARWQVLQWNTLGTGGLEMLLLWRGEQLREEAMRSAATISVYHAKLDAILVAMAQQLGALQAAPHGLGHIAWACFLGYLDMRFDELNWRAGWPEGAAWFAQAQGWPGMAESLPDATGPGALVWRIET